jgi:hypothetical protein
MSYLLQIKPISYLKANAAEVLLRAVKPLKRGGMQ